MDRENLRFTILKALSDSPGATSNQEVLIRKLRIDEGLVVGRDQMRNELSWLANIEAIVLKDSRGVVIATLDTPGEEHLQGSPLLPGIRRPTAAEMQKWQGARSS